MPSRTRWSPSSQKPRTARCTSAALRCTCRTHQATRFRASTTCAISASSVPCRRPSRHSRCLELRRGRRRPGIEFAEAPYAVTADRDPAPPARLLRRARRRRTADQLIPQWQLSSIEEDARRASVSSPGSALFSEPAIEGVDAAAASAAAAEPQGTVTPSDGASASAAEADRTSHPSQQDTTMLTKPRSMSANASSTSASNCWPPAKHRWPSKSRNIATRSPSSPKPGQPADCCRARRLR